METNDIITQNSSDEPYILSDDYKPGVDFPNPSYEAMFSFQFLVRRDCVEEDFAKVVEAQKKLKALVKDTDAMVDYSDVVIVSMDPDLCKMVGIKHDWSIAERSYDEEFHVFIRFAFDQAFISFKGLLRFISAMKVALDGLEVEVQSLYTSNHSHDEFAWRSGNSDFLSAAYSWFVLHTGYDNSDYFYILMWMNSVFFKNEPERLFSMIDYIRTDKVLVESSAFKMDFWTHHGLLGLDENDKVEVPLNIPRHTLIRNYVTLSNEILEDRFFVGVFFNDASCIKEAEDYSCFTNSTPTKYIIDILRNYADTQKIRKICLNIYPESGKFAYILDLGEKYISMRDEYDSVVMLIIGCFEKGDDVNRELSDALNIINGLDFEVKIGEDLLNRIKFC
jgi:hypothetical protein